MLVPDPDAKTAKGTFTRIRPRVDGDQEGIRVPLVPDGRLGTVPGDQPGLRGKGQHLAADRVHEHPVVPARQIGAPDRAEEDHVAHDGHGLRGGNEDYVARCVAGSKDDFELGAAEGDVDAGDEVVVRGRQLQVADAEGSGLGGDVVVEDAVVGVQMDGGAGGRPGQGECRPRDPGGRGSGESRPLPGSGRGRPQGPRRVAAPGSTRTAVRPSAQTTRTVFCTNGPPVKLRISKAGSESDREGTAATASPGGLRIPEGESRAHQRRDVVDLDPFQVLRAEGVHEDPDPRRAEGSRRPRRGPRRCPLRTGTRSSLPGGRRPAVRLPGSRRTPREIPAPLLPLQG